MSVPCLSSVFIHIFTHFVPFPHLYLHALNHSTSDSPPTCSPSMFWCLAGPLPSPPVSRLPVATSTVIFRASSQLPPHVVYIPSCLDPSVVHSPSHLPHLGFLPFPLCFPLLPIVSRWASSHIGRSWRHSFSHIVASPCRAFVSHISLPASRFHLVSFSFCNAYACHPWLS